MTPGLDWVIKVVEKRLIDNLVRRSRLLTREYRGASAIGGCRGFGGAPQLPTPPRLGDTGG